jgi:deazaflavin-dependent oxidoreductase (nitroreductase family)
MSPSTPREEHPNHAPGVPMIIPVWLERFQIKYVNPMLKPLSRRMPGFAVIKHRGRTSGKDYETIVTAYRKGDVLAIGLVHGKTNWVKNVLAAGEADIHVGRKDLHLVNPRVLPVGTVDGALPRIPQMLAKRQGTFVADIS